MLREDMQCANYLPVCYPARDLNVGANGSMLLLYNFDQTWKRGPGCDVFSPCSMKQDTGYEKEVLKQTMIKQEAIFIDQVNELHRLYKRQRELMDDIKRTAHSQYQMQPHFHYFPSEPVFTKKTCYNPTLSLAKPVHGGPSVWSMRTFQASSSSFAGKSRQTGLNSLLAESSSIGSLVLSPESKKPGKKRVLDLEIPADEYIDSEEGEQFEEGKLSKTPRQYGSKLSTAAYEGGFQRTGSSLRKDNNILDLNGPIQVKKEETLTFDNLPGRTIQVGGNMKACLDTVNLQMDTQKESPCFNHEAEICPDTCHVNGNSADRPTLGGIKSLQNNLFLKSQLKSITLKATSLDAQTCENNGSPTSEHSDPSKPLNKSLCMGLASSKGMDFNHLSSGEDNKPSGSRFLIDLNSCISENESYSVYIDSSDVTKPTTEMDLEAPVSPENKEVSPPRGESEETQLETSVQLSEQEVRDPQLELVRVAAETLVTISSSQGLSLVDNECLTWFAGIASSSTGDLKIDLELLPRGIDSFEEKLEERDAGLNAYFGRINGLKVNRRGVMLSRSFQRKGRTKRVRQRQHKGYRTEVLPAFASPYRKEVSGAEVGPIEAGLIGWGKTKRRQRGRRVPSSNPYLGFQMRKVLSI